jgi:hypothetical protein
MRDLKIKDKEGNLVEGKWNGKVYDVFVVETEDGKIARGYWNHKIYKDEDDLVVYINKEKISKVKSLNYDNEFVRIYLNNIEYIVNKKDLYISNIF